MLKAKFLQTKVENPKLGQSEIADHLRYSSSRLQRYRSNINMLLPDLIQPNNTNERAKKVSKTNPDNNSHREHDFKRPQMTSNDLKTISDEPVQKNNLKDGAVVENNNECLDEILDKKIINGTSNSKISNDQTVRKKNIEYIAYISYYKV